MGTLMDKILSDKQTNNSQTRVRLLEEQLIDLIKNQAWTEHQFQFAESEIKRVLVYIHESEEAESPKALQAWVNSMVTRMIQLRGHVPEGWTKKTRCAHCGYVWSIDNVDKLICGWCWLRELGKEFPHP